jgi:hypothetical protein
MSDEGRILQTDEGQILQRGPYDRSRQVSTHCHVLTFYLFLDLCCFINIYVCFVTVDGPFGELSHGHSRLHLARKLRHKR